MYATQFFDTSLRCNGCMRPYKGHVAATAAILISRGTSNESRCPSPSTVTSVETGRPRADIRAVPLDELILARVKVEPPHGLTRRFGVAGEVQVGETGMRDAAGKIRRGGRGGGRAVG